MLTPDLQILGRRHKDIRNGLSAPPALTLATLMELAMGPRRYFDMQGTSLRQFGNIVGHEKGIDDVSAVGAWTAQQLDRRAVGQTSNGSGNDVGRAAHPEGHHGS